MEILGIDIGGSGIKGAPIDTVNGELVTERHRIPTPEHSSPEAVGDVVAELVNHFKWSGPIGCTFPAIVKNGFVLSAANVDNGWIGVNGEELLSKKTGCPVYLLNDADAAGVAEMELGAGVNKSGVVIILTFGTGIGSAIFLDGKLLPNTEFGHMEFHNMDAEHWAASRVRKDEGLSWKKWGMRVDEYLQKMTLLFSPDLFIIGGGVSKKHEKFFKHITVDVPVVPAAMRNFAGMIGAAMMAKTLT